jgi:formylglycine-generating enzyme required for sulfatase activity
MDFPTRAIALLAKAVALAAVAAAAGHPANAQTRSPGDTISQAIPGTEVSFTMAFVPAGEFTLGSPDDEPGRDQDEGPRRRAVVDAFWMGVHEVTFDSYAIFRHEHLDNPVGPGDDAFPVEMVTRPSPPYEDPSRGMSGPGRPMTGITRVGAMEFARWLSEKTGRLYRLPTEVEWEYACRAGRDQIYAFGDDPADLDTHSWFEPNSDGSFREVGLKAPNAWGLFDIHGNVAEWTMDPYDPDFYEGLAEDGPAANPRTGESSRGLGVVRGGSFQDAAPGLRCAERHAEETRWKRRDPQIPKSRWWNTDSPHVGFRLVSPAREHTHEEIRSYWDRVLGER